MNLGYCILYVPDVAAAVAFYETAFALEKRFVHESGTYAEMETGATALGFAAESIASDNVSFRKQRPAGEPPAVEIAFVTEDVQAAVDRAVKAGAKLLKKPTTKPWGQVVSYVADLNGFVVELCTKVG